MNFVFDIDGTISFDGHTIDFRIKEALKKGGEFGHEVVFASARSYRDCIKLLGEDLCNNTVIGLNGGLVFRKGKKYLSHDLDEEVFREAVEFCHSNNIPYFVDDDFNYASLNEEKMPFYTNVDLDSIGQKIPAYEMGSPIKMVVFFKEDMDKLDTLINIVETYNNTLVSYHEREFCLYLNPLGITKASTLSDLLENDFIAFGNDKNDIEMFKMAKKSIQIGNYEDVAPFAYEQIPLEGDFEAAIASKIMDLFIEES